MMSETIRVNFGHSIALFPLSGSVLLPHAVIRLNVFEPRYRQMVGECLDRTGQIAIATIDRNRDDVATLGMPEEPTPVRTAACVGQIIQHKMLADGRYDLWLHGVCRARIKEVIEPEGERAYRLARLAPIESLDTPPTPMPEVRRELRHLLSGEDARHLRGIDMLLEWVNREDVPTHALIELIAFALINDTDRKYQLLAEPKPERRACLLRAEIEYLRGIVARARRQGHDSWPKGLSWN